ncbi:MAG: acyl-CoA thioester hydrolase/BAAT C-terminal domain-containing protein [Eubacteriales bacterium]|nr:acyl-CoA thioester hydrolase/BAAT C-terminal domain-containing protein [Eubacteriales bacterium]
MKREYFDTKMNGFYGVYYENNNLTDKAFIVMLGDSSDDYLVRSGVKWLHRQGFSVMAMSPDKKDYGHHNLPLERFGAAIRVMQAKGIHKIGLIGASTTGMLALLAASYYPQITLTIALSPSDFVMEGFYQDGKDGANERPGENESTVTWQGKPLPYLPFAYRHPEYWQKIKEESKAGRDLIASRKMFEESERRHPVREEEKIKVENIHGHIVFIGAEDDVLWDTVKYIHRMDERLKNMPHNCTWQMLLYKHGTHFAFPESLLKQIIPIGSGLLVRFAFQAGRKYAKECRQTRIDIDKSLKTIFNEWETRDE